jgi:hypothetical protein
MISKKYEVVCDSCGTLIDIAYTYKEAQRIGYKKDGKCYCEDCNENI